MTELTAPLPSEKVPRRKVIFRWSFITILLLWLILPLIPLVIWSFAFRWPFPLLWPESWSMRAWELAFSESTGVLSAIWDSLVIATIVTVVSVIISIPAGRGLGMYNFKGKRFIEFLLLAPTIVPPLAVILGVLVLFIRYGLADTFLGVILVQLSPIMPYVVLVMAGVFSNYDPEFEEQARSLGAGPIRTFWYVTLPAIFPGMMVAGLFAFLISWSQYITTLLIGGGVIKTLPLVLFTLAGTNDTALTASVSIIFVLPAVVILLISSRYVTGEDAAIGGIGGV
ncbi:MAG: ABC transporter permease subunit [Chloroflexi bacterium]|nr:ABC transporter permease subunit [Chloroflexota bacterium]